MLGAVHIGVLKSMHEHDLKPAYLAGTSTGAFIAALYAFGVSLDKIEEIAREINWSDVVDLALPEQGLLSNKKLGRTLEKHIGPNRIEQASIPLAIVATDISCGEKVVLREGELGAAVTASSCIPGLFNPVTIDGRKLVDGGLVDNVPVLPLCETEAEFIIAVNLSDLKQFLPVTNVVDVLINTMNIVMKHSTRPRVEQADLLIAPDLSSYNPMDSNATSTLIEIGYETTCSLLESL